jgi:hypothetical protein
MPNWSNKLLSYSSFNPRASANWASVVSVVSSNSFNLSRVKVPKYSSKLSSEPPLEIAPTAPIALLSPA